MSRDDGFAIADMDSGYFEDAKMRDLWQRLRDPDRMARALCLHSATLLASWRAGERVTVTQAAPLWLIADDELVSVLRTVKLLDRGGRIPATSWAEWFEVAQQRRAARRQAGALGGAASALSRTTDAQRKPKQPLTDAEPVRPSVPTVPTGPSDTRETPDGRDDLEAFLQVRFSAPTPRQRSFLDAYVRTFDVTGPARAARLIWANPDDPIGALKADLAAWRAERTAEAKAAEAPKAPAPRRASGLTGVNAELAAMFAAKDREAVS